MSDLMATVKRVFPDARVEREGTFVVIDGFLYIEPIKYNVRAIGREREVDGFQLTVGHPNGDVEELERSAIMGGVVIAAARYHGGWKASQVLEQIGNEEFANELAAD
jgi:hypothetical protein